MTNVLFEFLLILTYIRDSLKITFFSWYDFLYMSLFYIKESIKNKCI